MFYNSNSVPLSVKVPFLVSSSYRKAVQARDQILDIIAKRLESQDSTFLKEAREKSRQTGAINDDFFKVGLVLYILLILFLSHCPLASRALEISCYRKRMQKIFDLL